MGPEGWLRDIEADALRRHARGRVIEIGTWRGLSAGVMAPLCDLLWCVDPHKGMEIDGTFHGSWEPFLDFLKNHDNIIPVRLTIREAWYQFAIPEKPHFIYIDGDHSEAAVAWDLQFALNRCDIVGLHDYGVGGYGVTAVVDKFIQEGAAHLIDRGGSLVILKKGSLGGE